MHIDAAGVEACHPPQKNTFWDHFVISRKIPCPLILISTQRCMCSKEACVHEHRARERWGIGDPFLVKCHAFARLEVNNRRECHFPIRHSDAVPVLKTGPGRGRRFFNSDSENCGYFLKNIYECKKNAFVKIFFVLESDRGGETSECTRGRISLQNPKTCLRG